jgi:hypothetical protein
MLEIESRLFFIRFTAIKSIKYNFKIWSSSNSNRDSVIFNEKYPGASTIFSKQIFVEICK